LNPKIGGIMQLSPNFALALLTQSETAVERGIDNTPPQEVLDNLRLLAAGLEQVQALLGAPLEISSGYRSPDLNAAVGGAQSSQHCQGLAVDFTCPEFGSPIEIAASIRDSGIRYDQCILEFNRWVHISFSPEPRLRALSIYDPKEGYLVGLWDPDGNKVG
jgi:zinc D-Ala-D-Ala carboxypeptidase